MRTQIFALFLTCICTVSVYGQDTLAYTRKPTNLYVAAQQLKALKNGALVVRLKTNDKSIAAYRSMGKNELANKIVAEREALNRKISDAFRYNFSFCKVYFIYAKNTDALLKRQPYIFLNENLQVDSSIQLKEDFFLIAEYGSFTTNERVDEYRYSGVYQTQPTNTTASESSYVIMDTTLTQLQEPFPFYVPVYLGSFMKSADQLSNNINKAYVNLLYREENKEMKLKKSDHSK